MTNKARAKGTAFETACVRFLNEEGFPHAHRLPLGSPKGDIAGIKGVTWEAKDHKSMTLGAFLAQAEKAAAKNGDEIPVVFHKRHRRSIHHAYCTLPAWALTQLLREAGYSEVST